RDARATRVVDRRLTNSEIEVRAGKYAGPALLRAPGKIAKRTQQQCAAGNALNKPATRKLRRCGQIISKQHVDPPIEVGRRLRLQQVQSARRAGARANGGIRLEGGRKA